MAPTDIDFVVVGAGALGLSAARSLARRGHDVVVCEQATVGHQSSGSKGAARIFRLGYDDPAYVRLAMVAKRLWRALEAEWDTTLLTTTGQVTFGDDLDVLVDALTEAGAPHQPMTAPEVTARFPALSVPSPAVFEPESGVIRADTFLARLGQEDGVDVRQRTTVVRLEDDGRRVGVGIESPDGVDVLRARGVVVCAGPWTASLAADRAVGLEPMATLEQVAYLGPVPGSRATAVDDIPVIVDRDRPWFYGLPVSSTGLMKISLHGAAPPVSLDDLWRPAAPDTALVEALVASARRLLPGLVPEPVATERCVYDNSPDGDFVLDRFGGVVIGSGTSGHGFKFAPLLGEVLADLATGAPHDPIIGPSADLDRFAWRRQRTRPPADPLRHP